MTDLQIIGELLYKRSTGTITPGELVVLKEWASASPGNQLLLEELDDEDILSRKLLDFHPDNQQQNRDEILAKVNEQRGKIKKISSVHRVHFLKTAWFRYAAALILLFGIGAYLRTTQYNTPLTVQNKPVPVKNDVLPGGNKAILTLADGSTITLDSVAKGQIAQQPGARITKAGNGEIIYSFDRSRTSERVSYNTMSTPRGGQHQLVLPDGSKVWLNAESSITFPTAFTGNFREVKMTGEVYFEIARNKEKPFIVKTSKDVITVLGTSFNVNAYPEDVTKTSLVDGSLKVNNKILQSGQAYVNEKIIATDTQQDIAWKNGFFNFQHSTLEQAMRQLARWYNVKIEYRGERREVEFGGEIDRSLSLQRVIKGLEGIENLHFELEGKILTVTF